ncbi:MAG TPA: hypothetical protein VG500_05735, partial [Gemmatimonadales bacterium]|nr:hypothetical protein [Gemmatimonadales bacterium]
RVNGVAKDSRRIELGNGAPIAERDREAFEQERDRLAELLSADSSTSYQLSAISYQGESAGQPTPGDQP